MANAVVLSRADWELISALFSVCGTHKVIIEDRVIQAEGGILVRSEYYDFTWHKGRVTVDFCGKRMFECSCPIPEDKFSVDFRDWLWNEIYDRTSEGE